MIDVVEQHLKAEGAGDIEGAVAPYHEDIVHDAVGFPGSPRQGKDAAREFYAYLTANFLERALQNHDQFLPKSEAKNHRRH